MPTVASFCLIISADIFSFYLLSLFVLPAVLVSLVAALPFCGPAALGPGHKGTRDIKPCFAAQVLSFEVDLAGLLDWYSAEGSLYQRQQLGGVRSG